MRKLSFVLALIFVLFSGLRAGAQAFRKGALLVSISEGYTNAHYTAWDNTKDGTMHTRNIDGDRDPITLEYGISDRWGLGINLGGDVFHVDPSRFYGFTVPGNRVQVITSEATADAHFHFFVTKKTDLSMFGSVGFAGVMIKGNTGDYSYNYNAGGAIVRIGAEVRYYFFRHFGALAMLSGFSSSCSNEGLKDNNVAKNYTTALKGYAFELGICYRFRR